MTRERDSLERLCRRVREHEAPSAGDRAFVRDQLAARIAAAGVAAAAAASAGKATAASGAAEALGASGSATVAGAAGLKLGSLAGVGAWLAGGASVTAVAAMLVHSLGGVPERSPLVAPPAPPLAVSARARPVAPKAPLRDPAPPPAPAPIEAVPAATPERSRAQLPVAASAKPNLADEARDLARVQRALRDGDANTALALLDEQDRRFRGGSLKAERAAARALAGCAAGRGQARVQAERFVAQHAGSPLAERVQRKCLGSR